MNHLGGKQSATFITTTLSAGVAASIYSMSLPVGSWIITGNLRFPTTSSYTGLSISATNNTEDLNAEVIFTSGAGNLQVTRGVTVTSGTQTWYLVAVSGTANICANSTFDAYRIG